VIDPGSLQVSRRGRRVKTDRVDVKDTAAYADRLENQWSSSIGPGGRHQSVRAGGKRHVWSLVRIPSIEEEDLRRSHRERSRRMTTAGTVAMRPNAAASNASARPGAPQQDWWCELGDADEACSWCPPRCRTSRQKLLSHRWSPGARPRRSAQSRDRALPSTATSARACMIVRRCRRTLRLARRARSLSPDTRQRGEASPISPNFTTKSQKTCPRAKGRAATTRRRPTTLRCLRRYLARESDSKER
jgi:hypothetical protein